MTTRMGMGRQATFFDRSFVLMMMAALVVGVPPAFNCRDYGITNMNYKPADSFRYLIACLHSQTVSNSSFIFFLPEFFIFEFRDRAVP